jgi:hypothetical protein
LATIANAVLLQLDQSGALNTLINREQIAWTERLPVATMLSCPREDAMSSRVEAIYQFSETFEYIQTFFARILNVSPEKTRI